MGQRLKVSQTHRCKARRVEVKYFSQNKLWTAAVTQTQPQEGKIPNIIFHKGDISAESLTA